MNDKRAEDKSILTVEQISAGGVAFRQNDSDFEIAIISVKPSRRWQLPKGIVDKGETNETAALREMREEAGIETDCLIKSKQSSIGITARKMASACGFIN